MSIKLSDEPASLSSLYIYGTIKFRINNINDKYYKDPRTLKCAEPLRFARIRIEDKTPIRLQDRLIKLNTYSSTNIKKK